MKTQFWQLTLMLEVSAEDLRYEGYVIFPVYVLKNTLLNEKCL